MWRGAGGCLRGRATPTAVTRSQRSNGATVTGQDDHPLRCALQRSSRAHVTSPLPTPSMPRARLASSSLVALLTVFAATPLLAQGTPAATPAPAPAPAPLSISGLLFGSYNFTPSTTPNQLNNQNDNGFILDRAYINFRAPAGDHMSIRVTTDVYQTTEGTPNAYTIRAKYAYLQYDGTKSASGAALMGRIGILQNVLIDHEETFWPRYLSQTAIERAGYFSSADAGIAAGLTLPDKMGEVYSTVVNGSSYTSR